MGLKNEFRADPTLRLMMHVVSKALRQIKAKPRFSEKDMYVNEVIGWAREYGVDYYVEVGSKDFSLLHISFQLTRAPRSFGELRITIYSNTNHNLCAEPFCIFEFLWSEVGIFKILQVKRRA